MQTLDLRSARYSGDMTSEDTGHYDWVTSRHQAKPKTAFTSLATAVALDCGRLNKAVGREVCEFINEGVDAMTVRVSGWTAHAYLLEDRVCVSYHDHHAMRPAGDTPAEFSLTIGYDSDKCHVAYYEEDEPLELWKASRRLLEPIMFHPVNRF